MSSTDPGSVSFSLKAISLSSVFMALAASVTLAIVATVKDVDALSTVALALAVLAFVAQLMVFIAQAAGASQQSRQSQELHGQMMSVLSQIEERTDGTQRSLDGMSTKLLEALIGKVQNEGAGVGTEAFARRLSRTLNRDGPSLMPDLLSDPSGSPRSGSARWPFPPPVPPNEAQRINEEMRSWPEPEEIELSLSTMRALSDGDLRQMRGFARDLTSNTQPDASLGPGLLLLGRTELESLGMVEEVPGWEHLHTLTPRGRGIGRILTAVGEPPAFKEQINELVQKAIRLEEEYLPSTHAQQT